MSNASIRILIVEDETAVRQYFLRALSRSIPNLELYEAEDGLRALSMLRRLPIDLVLSDQRMPLLTGLELLQMVRAESNLPFLLISADRSIECAALAAGATAFLSKPIALNDLRIAVTSALQIKPLRPAGLFQQPAMLTLDNQSGELPQLC
ncbi:MAG: response regulator [Oscillochloridaceae bacterium umkhey_bin13]